MAGVDHRLPGRSVGAQGHPHRLPPAGARTRSPPRTCAATSRRRSSISAAMLDRFNAISAAFAEPDADFDKLMEEQARVQEYIDTHDLWNLDNTIEVAMDALRLPPGDADVSTLSGGERRRVALCKVLLEAARHAPPRRADQPPRRGERGVAGAAPGELPRDRRRDHARSLLPRQRREVDPWSWTAGAACRTRGTTRAGWSRRSDRLAKEEKQASARQRTLERELEWVRMSPRARARARARRACRRMSSSRARRSRSASRRTRSSSPPRRDSATRSSSRAS